jgi:hypothetical protein
LNCGGAASAAPPPETGCRDWRRRGDSHAKQRQQVRDDVYRTSEWGGDPVPSVKAACFDSMSERELERLYAGLVKLAALPDEELRALVEHVLTETDDD